MQNFIWDFDGTLYDTYPGMMAALVQVAQENGAAIDAAKTLVAIKAGSIKDWLQTFAAERGLDYATLDKRFHDLEATKLGMAKPYPQTAALLQRIHEAGGNNLLMTHRDKSAWTLLDRDGFADWFLGGVTTELHLKRKPDPEAINYLLERYQLNPEVTVMVGDRRLDIVAGQNAHVHTAYFNVDGLNDAPMADWQVDHLQDLAKLIKA